MFERTVLLYGVVAAVVVGKQQTLARNHLASATSAENNYGVFQARPIDAVNIFGSKPATHFLHGADIQLFQKRQ